MERKVRAILLILLMGAAFLTLGCAGKKNIGGEAPSVPAATAGAEPSATSHASAPPAVPPETTAPASGSGSSAPSGLDPSLADISGEGSDMGSSSDTDTGLPTPAISL